MNHDELKKQRKIVAAHLDWLDQQIASHQTEGNSAQQTNSGLPEILTQEQSTKQATPSSPHSTDEAETIPDLALSDTGNSTQSTKIGCLIAGAILFVIAFSLFWVLPFFIYGE